MISIAHYIPRRISAAIIDGYISTSIFFNIFLCILLLPDFIRLNLIYLLVIIIMLLAIIIPLAYQVFCLDKFQTSYGKKLMGLKLYSVKNANKDNIQNENISKTKLIIRELTKMVIYYFFFYFILFIDLILLLSQNNKQTLLDKITSTKVIEDKNLKDLNFKKVAFNIILLFSITFIAHLILLGFVLAVYGR